MFTLILVLFSYNFKFNFLLGLLFILAVRASILISTVHYCIDSTYKQFTKTSGTDKNNSESINVLHIVSALPRGKKDDFYVIIY